MATEDLPVSPAEQMVTAAALEIVDADVVFVGMRLPLLGFLVAKGTHAPRAVGVYELGVVRDVSSPEPVLTMGDLPNLYQATWLADTIDAMSLLQRGDVDISFIGGAQVDRFGNLNTTYAAAPQGGWTRLPGSGGACDLACLARRHIIIMTHEKRRFVERVDYNTSPGYGDGPDWRGKTGLPRGGPAAVITTLGVFRFDFRSAEMVLASLHAGVRLAEVQAQTGWPLKVSEDLTCTPKPTRRQLSVLRRYDPERYWTG